jgi:pimeloyl-ACP methyl ester carboxylesterase
LSEPRTIPSQSTLCSSRRDMDRRARRTLQFLATGAFAAAGGAFTALRSAQAMRAEPPINALGGRQRRWRWRENEIFITELGDGPPILLIHGIYAGASSFEFRHLAPLLAKNHRVIAMDFLGCGLSDRPKLHYTAELFVNQILDVLTELQLESPLLIGSSLGATFAIRAAARTDGRIGGVVAINPTGLEGQDERSSLLRQASEALMRAPIVGEGLFASLTTAPVLRTFLRRVYSQPSWITPEVMAHYESMVRVPGGRYVTAAFVGGTLACDLSSDLPFLSTPIYVLWGEQSPFGGAQEYVALGNNVELTTYADSGALPHEEIPETCSQDIERFFGNLQNFSASEELAR